MMSTINDAGLVLAKIGVTMLVLPMAFLCVSFGGNGKEFGDMLTEIWRK